MAGLDNPKIIVVCGPTASGKSALALDLARRFGGEILGADSMQIYQGLVVGTAAITGEEADGVPQHLVGFLPPERRYSVAEYQADAGAAIASILARGSLPVVCGGTGLYISALMQGLRFCEEPGAPALRHKLEAAWETDAGASVRARLAEADPEAAERLHPNDKKRLVRALESVLATGRTARQREEASHPAEAPYNALVLGLEYPDRHALYQRINRRVEHMMENGLPEEARRVYQNRSRYSTAAQAIGYKELFPYFEGEATLEACVEKLQQATRNYAKRQLTWFRRMEGVHWLDAGSKNLFAEAAALAKTFLQ